jgi:hypothetical protein
MLLLSVLPKAGRSDRPYCVGDNVIVVSPHRSSLSVGFRLGRQFIVPYPCR